MVRQLTTNEDKKSVCLVCKQMQTIATPYLYRNMEIACKFLGQRYLDRITKARYGLQSVRTLRIVHSWTMKSSISNKRRVSNAIWSLLSAIPKNSLTQFVYV
jgi:predicted thioesterase